MDDHSRCNQKRRSVLAALATGAMLSACVLDREGTKSLLNENHFYTIDPDEAERALDEYGYRLDGVTVAGHVFPERHNVGSAATVPLYRLYNPTLVDHFYTIDPAERATALNLGYINDGIPVACHVFQSQVDGTTAFFRLWKGAGSTGNHFYTVNPGERDTAVSVHGYDDEGSEGFIYPPSNTSIVGAVPLYRLYKGTVIS